MAEPAPTLGQSSSAVTSLNTAAPAPVAVGADDATRAAFSRAVTAFRRLSACLVVCLVGMAGLATVGWWGAESRYHNYRVSFGYAADTRDDGTMSSLGFPLGFGGFLAGPVATLGSLAVATRTYFKVAHSTSHRSASAVLQEFATDRSRTERLRREMAAIAAFIGGTAFLFVVLLAIEGAQLDAQWPEAGPFLAVAVTACAIYTRKRLLEVDSLALELAGREGGESLSVPVVVGRPAAAAHPTAYPNANWALACAQFLAWVAFFGGQGIAASCGTCDGALDESCDDRCAHVIGVIFVMIIGVICFGVWLLTGLCAHVGCLGGSRRSCHIAFCVFIGVLYVFGTIIGFMVACMCQAGFVSYQVITFGLYVTVVSTSEWFGVKQQQQEQQQQQQQQTHSIEEN